MPGKAKAKPEKVWDRIKIEVEKFDVDLSVDLNPTIGHLTYNFFRGEGAYNQHQNLELSGASIRPDENGAKGNSYIYNFLPSARVMCGEVRNRRYRLLDLLDHITQYGYNTQLLRWGGD